MNPNTLLLPTVWPRAEPAAVAQCVLLALLAHIWLVLMLGNTAGGTARPGEGVWGAVNVTLRGPETPSAVAVPAPPVPAVATGPVGQAETPRWGGAVRSQPAPELPPEPGAAQLGNWAPLPASVAAVAPMTPLPLAPMPVPVPVPAAAPMPMPMPLPLRMPLPERKLASALGRPATPTAVTEALARPPAATAPTLGRLPELSTPTAAPLMAPRQAPPALGAPVTALPSSQPVAAPVVVAEPATVMKQLLAPAPPVAALPSVTAAALPQVAAVPLQQVAAALLPQAAAAPAGVADAGTRLGHDVAGAAALPASAPSRLNLQLARPRGGELSRGLGGGVLAVLPRPPEVDEKLGQQIAKSAKADCRGAYAAAGLLAVVPLVVEALRQDGSCKW